MRILAIGAHPDDIEYGCGGMLLKYVKSGHDLFLLVMTEGEVGGDGVVRKTEQEVAAEILHAQKVFWGGFRDTEIPVDKKTISVIEHAIDTANPDEVYVNYYDDTHQDHRTLAHCVISATRYVKRVLFYEDYTTCNFEPNIFIDINDVLEDKVKLMKAHHSQISKCYPTGLDIVESVKAIANFRGFQGKVKYAEGFKAFRFLKEI
jgi:LmbE family N-acetylglucosaminyl deacetylase